MYRSNLLRSASACALTLPSSRFRLRTGGVAGDRRRRRRAGACPAGGGGGLGAARLQPRGKAEAARLSRTDGADFHDGRWQELQGYAALHHRRLAPIQPRHVVQTGQRPARHRDFDSRLLGPQWLRRAQHRAARGRISVTQPDGLSRTDLTDPHAYAAVDVYRGPSSALFGNFANGGAINFRTRTGAEIDGVETGHEFGSYRLHQQLHGDRQEASAISTSRSSPATCAATASTQHSQYDTQTDQYDGALSADADDLIVFKGIHNELFGNLSPRLSLNQYYLNPYQRGCVARAAGSNRATAWPGADSGSPSAQRRRGRDDVQTTRRSWPVSTATIGATCSACAGSMISTKTRNGARRPFTTTRTSFSRRAPPVALQDEPAVNASTDITQHRSLLGMTRLITLGLYFNRTRYDELHRATFFPIGDGATGAHDKQAERDDAESRRCARREELALSPTVTGVLGLAAEMTKIAAYRELQHQFSHNADPGRASSTPISTYWNFAPEASVTWRAIRSAKRISAPRPATARRTPASYSSISRTDGRQYESQDAAQHRLRHRLRLDADADAARQPDRLPRMVSERAADPDAGSRTAGLTPSTRRVRSIAASSFCVDWRPIEGWRVLANYTYNNQIFTNFTEQLGRKDRPISIAPATRFRASRRMSSPHASAMIMPYGDLKGLGAFVEYVYKSSYFMDNGNQLTMPSYGVVNVNLHYRSRPCNPLILKNFSAFFEVRNVFDRNYIASANNITNTVSLATGVPKSGNRSGAKRDRLDLRRQSAPVPGRGEVQVLTAALRTSERLRRAPLFKRRSAETALPDAQIEQQSKNGSGSPFRRPRRSSANAHVNGAAFYCSRWRWPFRPWRRRRPISRWLGVRRSALLHSNLFAIRRPRRR